MSHDGSGRPSLPPFIFDYLRSIVGDAAVTSAQIREAKSAQQQVFIITFPPSTTTCQHAPWQDALKTGRHNLVLRIWKGSARWWNLHSRLPESLDSGVVSLARAEVAGYRIARGALAQTQVEIPRVLYFSHDPGEAEKYSEVQPWAIMSYVGPTSLFYDESSCIPTDEWVEGMVKIRPEFGFEEPHPRWGRVPVDQCLDYVFHVLTRFIVPMHRYFLSTEASALDWTHLGGSSSNGKIQPRNYGDMIQLYRSSHARMVRKLNASTTDAMQEKIVGILGLCIEQLALEAEQCGVEDMLPVLCHMDCQPQNLVFYNEGESRLPNLHSVLDWEEAAYADPRFEILLLCRKVCANREQANAVWDLYTKEIHGIEPNLAIGPIEPWLKLETVHSITTLVLQSMDLLGGGRSPWETKPDLLGKIEREFHRLQVLGWTFCKEVAA